MTLVRPRSVLLLAVVLALVLVMFSSSAMWRADALPGPSESTTVSVTPERVLDTRDPNNIGLPGPFVSPVAQKLKITGTVATATGSKVVVPDGATGVLLNVTSVGSTADGFISVRPGDATGAPTTSSLNFVAGVTTPNAVQVTLPTTGPNAGQIDITYDALGVAGPTTDILIDVVGYTTNTGLQEVNTELGKKVSGSTLGMAPVKVTATDGASPAAARAAAPETSLWKNDTLEVYAKCYYDTVGGTLYGDIYARTTSNGAMMEGSDDWPGASAGTAYLDTTTPEDMRQLYARTLSTMDRMNYNQSEGAMTAASGKGYQAHFSTALKLGTPPGGNGPFGTGNVCMFHGSVIG